MNSEGGEMIVYYDIFMNEARLYTVENIPIKLEKE